MKKILICIVVIITSFVCQEGISQTPQTVVGWVDWFSSTTADQGTAGNAAVSVLATEGGAGVILVSDADGTGQRGFATGWAGGMNTKAWRFPLITTKYSTLKYSCRMSGTSSPGSFLGPRDFKLQYSINGTSWTDVSGGTLQAGNGTSVFNSLSNVVLPAACENQPVLYLRMLMTSNTAVNGGTVNGGQSHVDDIVVTAVSIPEAPTDIALSNNIILLTTIGGSASPGIVVGNFSSADFNLGNTFIYSLVPGPGNTNNNSFSISGNILSTATSLVAGNYTIRVRSTDNASFFYERVLIIKVIEPDPVTQGSRQRISFMGTDGSATTNSNTPANICYNSTNNEYLSVWQGDDNTAPLVDNEFEIFGQRINAGTGVNTGARIRISFMGTDGVPSSHRGLNPYVAYNATNNEYFVVWQGDHNTGSLIAGEDEIWGQRVNAATGVLIGSMVRISTMGTDGIAAFDAQNSDISWNSVDNQYLVVWRGDDNTAPLIDNENEIYGQLITNTGVLSGSRLRVSTMGPDGNTSFNAATPGVFFNAADNQYMVVWQADDNTSPFIDNEFDVFGQRVSNTGLLAGVRIRISGMGPNGNASFGAQAPDITWNSTKNEYFVIWSADDNTGSLVDNENEIYGQIITNAGVLSGSRIRLSDMGADGNANLDAGNPKVSYNLFLDEYWVVWHGDDDATSIDNENEIFFQRVNSLGLEVSTNDIRVSYMGPLNNNSFNALQPAIAYNSVNTKAFAIWYGDDNTSPLVDNEYEIHGQSLFATAALPVTWISFTGEIQSNQTVLLNWKTATETNTKNFIIQRSTTSGNWNNIGIQLAANNSNNVQDYNFIDAKPNAGKNYYRLFQKDVDGASAYSNVVLIEYNKVKFGVFPNPVFKYLTVQLSNPGKATIILFDNSGRLINQAQVNGGNIVLDIEGVSAGIYYAQVLQQGFVYVRKFIKK